VPADVSNGVRRGSEGEVIEVTNGAERVLEVMR